MNDEPSTDHKPWAASSWRHHELVQQPHYADESALKEVLGQVAAMPPLVTPWEARRLEGQLAEAAAGKRFLLQGGDCAEVFSECKADVIANRIKVLLQMSLVLIYGLRMPVVRVGRFAGQYAKPRSSDLETRETMTLPSYRGDIVNGAEFTKTAREPDPERLLRAYHHAAATLNHVRALGEGGFADLHHPEYWDLGFVHQDALRSEYQGVVNAILASIRFTEAVSSERMSEMERVSFFTSHEALLLPFEEALTRKDSHSDDVFNLGTHFPWVGMRTSNLDGAHVEFLRGLANPIAVKVGPGMETSELQALVRHLNPDSRPGRLTLIARLGQEHVNTHLPAMIQAVRSTGIPVLWSCDPMHGNTETLSNGTKTRRFDTMLSELEESLDIHHVEGSVLGGVHLELTGENVTECTGGARGLQDRDLERAYHSQVDPRLNSEQALEMAFALIRKFRSLQA